MPLYEFKCRSCEHIWEARMPYKAPFPDCPECGGSEVRKVYHAAALIFKGSGWHVTDYGTGNGGNGKSNGPASGSRSSDSEGSSETPKSEGTATKSDS